MAAIFQTTFSYAFSWTKMNDIRLKFHWSLFLRFQLTIFQHWFRWWLGADQATSHYLNQWWLFYRRIYASLGLNKLKDDQYKFICDLYGPVSKFKSLYRLRIWRATRLHCCRKSNAGHEWIPAERPVTRPGALMFSLICAWMDDWVNNREAGDLGRHRAHYDVIIMSNHHIALEFDRRKSKVCQIIKLIGTILNKNIAVSRLHKILR